MPFDPIVAANRSRAAVVRDVALAIVLATVLTSCWALVDRQRLAALVLPDTDDMMRLAQVRDWLGGQAFADWTQYRLAPPLGAPMHWSRINDFGPAAIILAATPLLGRHGAELVAVILYPGVLFACHIALAARIARRLWSAEAAPVAAVLAALAYPGIAVFLPGRIDHHALQVVVIEIAVLALTRRPSRASGLVAGAAVGFGLTIGLETAPQVAALCAALFALWAVYGMAERHRLGGFAVGLCGATLLSLATLRPSYWSAAYCDAFTPATATGSLAVGVVLAALAVATPRLGDVRMRAIVGAAAGAAATGATLIAFPACLRGPYGVMDPFLRRALLSHITEANGLATQPFWDAVSMGGLSAAACVAAAWMVRSHVRSLPLMLPLVCAIAMSAAITLVQVRGAYIGAPLAAPLLAGLVLAARRRTAWRIPALAGAWLASTGITYLQGPAIVAQALARPAPVAAPAAMLACSGGDTWRQVDRYPAGAVMASTDIAAYLIGATRMATIGAGYHRNDRGNMAMYRYFLSPPARGAAIARTWNVRYVAFCPGDFSEIDVTTAYPRSLAALLQAGRTPPGFRRLPLRGVRLRLYRIDG